MVEGTLAGIAAGLVASGRLSVADAAVVSKTLHIRVDGEFRELALVDVAISRERYVATRAIWDLNTVYEVFLTRAEPAGIGLSSIGGRLHPLSLGDVGGLRYRLAGRDDRVNPAAAVIAPVAPGMVEPAVIAEWQMLEEGVPVQLEQRYCTVALDGERSLVLTPEDAVEIVLARDGPTGGAGAAGIIESVAAGPVQRRLTPVSPMLAGSELAIGLAALLLGSFVFSAVGFGMALAMAPILLLILAPQQVVVLANSMIVLATLLILAQTWRHFRWRQSWLFILAGLPPVPLGVFLLNTAAPALLRTAIVALILTIAVLSLLNVRMPAARTRWAAVGFGFTTTLLTTTLSIGGPLAGIYAIEQEWSRETMRATLAVYFLLAGVLGLALYVAVGLVPYGNGLQHRRGRAGGAGRSDGRRAGRPDG